MTIAEHLRAATARLTEVSDSARLDAELLIAQVLRCSRAALLAHDRDAVGEAEGQRIELLLARRARGEPVAYLLGTQGFWSLDLRVTPETLIPRPETETLVEWAVHLIEPAAPGTAPGVLDLGTGSGCIALAVARERPDVRVIATDRSPGALAVARDNAARNAISNVDFRAGCWFEALRRDDGPFDLVVSNPPYVAEHDPHLAALGFEPRGALVAGADGLDDLRVIVGQAPRWLRSGGWLLVEHGHDQGPAVRALFGLAGFARSETRRDLGGRERVTAGMRP